MTGGPAFVPPMLATVGSPGDVGGEGWLLERKFDGLRCVVVRDGDRVELWSRNRLSYRRRFAALSPAVAGLAADRFVLDGEIVAHAGDRMSFDLLGRDAPGRAIGLVCFDLLHLLGRDTTALPLVERRALLGRLLTGGHRALALSPDVAGSAGAALEVARAAGWEGLVAKRLDSAYRSGRSRSWRKLKVVTDQDLVVGGWTPSDAGRTGFGALAVGYHDDGGELRYAGKVGGGFEEAELRAIRRRIEAAEVPTSPFADPGPLRLPGVRWTRPELVVVVTFSEWTPDGRLRHPRFSGLRPDVAAGDVRRDPPPTG